MKRSPSRRRSLSPFMILLATSILACGPTIAVFNQHAYKNATTLKAEALAVMDMASQSYASHQEEVRRLLVEVEAAYEYAKGLPKNEITTEQWATLKDPSGGLLGGFLALWERQGTMSAAGIAAQRQNVADAFDTIIELEAAKIREED